MFLLLLLIINTYLSSPLYCFIVQNNYAVVLNGMTIDGIPILPRKNITNEININNNNNSKTVVQHCNKKVVGYYTSWSRKKIEEKHILRLTHIILAFVDMNQDGTLQITMTSDKEKNQKLNLLIEKLAYLKKLKRKYPHLKTMFAVGGWENSQYFSKMVHDQNLIKNFIYSAINILDTYDLDGIDIDWEHPVVGGAVEGLPDDKQLYVEFMRVFRYALNIQSEKKNRGEHYLLSFAGSASHTTLDRGYDLEQLLDIADWVNVMSYDYFGAWQSQWGAYTGPPAPLFHGAPKGYSGKMNVDFTLKYYTCKTRKPEKILMGLPFYGRYWLHVGATNNSANDSMWRMASAIGGEYLGGSMPYYQLNKVLKNTSFVQNHHQKSSSMFAINEKEHFFIGYDNPLTIKEKVKYAGSKNFGGVMIWAVDFDDENLSMLKAIESQDICGGNEKNKIQYFCSLVNEKRWWSYEDDLNSTTGEQRAGMCGRSAPLYNGYYPICDPNDPGYSCCNAYGYCGSSENCTCVGCVDYFNNPEKAIEEPVKPTQPIRWWTSSDGEGKMGRCGYDAPKIKVKNGNTTTEQIPICNPDDNLNHCCSNGGYCGTGKEFCECDGCVDFKKNPGNNFPEITWWTWARDPENAGKCGPTAPLLDGKYAICNPNSTVAYCCSLYGSCGSSPLYCDCQGCVNFKLNPNFKWKLDGI